MHFKNVGYLFAMEILLVLSACDNSSKVSSTRTAQPNKVLNQTNLVGDSVPAAESTVAVDAPPPAEVVPVVAESVATPVETGATANVLVPPIVPAPTAAEVVITDQALPAAQATAECIGASAFTMLPSATSVFTNLPGNNKTLVGGKSICDALLESKKNVGVFQLLHKDSITASKEVENIAHSLTLSPNRADIQHFVIVLGTSTEEEVAAFSARLGGGKLGVIYLRDEAQATYALFAKNVDQFILPTIVSMSIATRGLVSNDSQTTYLDGVRSADQLAAELSTASPVTANIFETVSTADWDGHAHRGTHVYDVINVR